MFQLFRDHLVRLSTLANQPSATMTTRRRLSLENLEPRNLLAIYPLTNAGFEEPALDLGNSWHPAVDGWTLSGGAGTTFEVPWSEASPAPEGAQYLFGESPSWSITQVGPVIAAQTRYILSVDVFALSTGSSQASILLREGANSSVLAGAATFSSANPSIRQISLSEGEWTTVTIGFNSRDFASLVGQTLEIRINGGYLAVDNVRLDVDSAIHDFYISSSAGSDTNDGFSASTPFRDFESLQPYLPLLPGERILLKAGDTFADELNIRGKGDANALVELSSYGEGPNPVIRRQNLASDVGVIWNNASYARISNIDVEHAKIGIYLRYEWTDVGSRNVTIEDSNFRDLTDPTLEPSWHNYEFAWSDAIWVGGQAWNQAEYSTRLENLTIRNITSVNAAHLFGTGWYFPGTYLSRVKNLIIEDSVAINNLGGAFQLFSVDGGHIKRVRSIGGGGQDTWSGTTLGFIQDSKNFLIADSEFSYIDRAQAGDGSGMDFEGNTENVTFRDNVIHNNDASALLILSTNGPHKNLVIENNTFYNNARDPWNSEINSEIQGSNASHTGIIRNNGIYRGDPSIHFFSPNANWSGFTIEGNRQLEYADVRTRETWWDFDTGGDFEGWGALNHWGDSAVIGGVLKGESTGVDPYIHSPPTWFPANEPTYAWVRMSQTAGNFAQVFYITDTDPVWNEEKSVFFNISADGQMRDYFVDLNASLDTKVITQIRLDPTITPGSQMEVDFVRLTNSNDPVQSPRPAPLPAPLSLKLTSIASEDGHVLESAANSSVGGTVSASASTFRLGDDANDRAYRKFLSFDTSVLPDNAIITQATIGITRVGNPTGNVPIGVANSQFGDLLVDIATPAFGDAALVSSDWESPATKLGVSKFAWPAWASAMTIYSRLEAADNQFVSTTGKTQYRIRYANDDDGDATADYMAYATSNHPNSAIRPSLEIEYYVPSTVAGDYNLNNVVDRGDYDMWKSHWGATQGVGLLADGNRDGVVNLADYVVWRDHFVVPEAVAAAIVAPPGTVAALWLSPGESVAQQPNEGFGVSSSTHTYHKFDATQADYLIEARAAAVAAWPPRSDSNESEPAEVASRQLPAVRTGFELRNSMAALDLAFDDDADRMQG